MTKETKKEKKDLTTSLICIILLFLANALYILHFVYGDFWRYPGEVLHKVFMMMWILLALLYITSLVGILQRRRFALYSSSILLMLSVILSVLITGIIVFAVVGLFLYLVLLFFLWKNEGYFKRFDRLDNWVLIGMLFLVVASAAAFEYSRCCVPSPEDYAKQRLAEVTKEAVEKDDWRVCDKLQEAYRSECKASFAASNKDPHLCKNVAVDNIRYNCYIDVASVLKDPEICDLIDEAIINEGLGGGINRTERCKGAVKFRLR